MDWVSIYLPYLLIMMQGKKQGMWENNKLNDQPWYM